MAMTNIVRRILRYFGIYSHEEVREHVLDIIKECGDIPGQDLRKRLGDLGYKMSSPAFYQFMSRVESETTIRGRDVCERMDGYSIRRRWYRGWVKPVTLEEKE